MLVGLPARFAVQILEQGLCARHLVRGWPVRFHHPLVLLETFVDPSQFVGTVYRGAGWTEVGMTRGFRRVRGGYRAVLTAKPVRLST